LVAIERKRVERPINIFVSKVLRNINTDVEEEKSDSASYMIKSINNFVGTVSGMV
jgi:hypothetical protein